VDPTARFTPKQRQIFDFIREHLARHGYAPNLEEIRGHMGLSSVSTVHEHLANMESKGLVKRRHHKARGTDLAVDPVVPSVELPVVLGASGTHFELVASDEHVAVPASMVGRGPHFAIRVHGVSMCGAEVRENDVLVVRPSSNARDGQLVVAVVLDRMLVVRRIFREEERLRLDPPGGDMQPLRMPKRSVHIHGVVVGLLRRYSTE